MNHSLPNITSIEITPLKYQLTYSWYSQSYYWYLLLPMFMFFFFAFVFYIASKIPNLLSEDVGGLIFMAILVLFFIGAGLWMMYDGFCGLNNSTTLTIENKTLSIRHFPYYWPGSTQIPLEHIESIKMEMVKKSFKSQLGPHEYPVIFIHLKNSSKKIKLIRLKDSMLEFVLNELNTQMASR